MPAKQAAVWAAAGDLPDMDVDLDALDDDLDAGRQAGGHAVGTVRLVNTMTVLERAAGKKYLPDKAAMRDTYTRLRSLDDGLPSIEATNLMSPTLWVP